MKILSRATSAAAASLRMSGRRAMSKVACEPLSAKSQHLVDLEQKYGCHNYAALPVVLEKGKGAKVWDVDGKEYLDFLAAYSAVNQGHCHPKILKALTDQASRMTLSSRAFYNANLGKWEQFMNDFFGYDKMLPMNTGVEAGDSAVKLARRWGYVNKGVPDNCAKVVFAKNNFWGRSIAAISSSTDPSSYDKFGPYVPGFLTVPYNDLEALEKTLASDPHIVAFMVEPIQGEAGVMVPDTGYLSKVHALCKKHNVLLIADEVQTGLARTGKMLCSEWDAVTPDILVLGKALSGGVYPVSCVLARDEIMLNIKPGQHGSTYGGNPMAAEVAIAALEVLRDEGMVENSRDLGDKFRARIEAINSPIIKLVRGRGLMNGVVIETPEDGSWDTKLFSLALRDEGLLCKPTHGDCLRFTPPLCLTEDQLHQGCDIIEKVVRKFE